MMRKHLEWAVELAFFLAFIAADFLFGIAMAVKVLGVATIVTGLMWVYRRNLPIGIEGRPPSYFLRGVPAVLSGIAMIVIGILLVWHSVQASCLLGWASAKVCP